MTILEQNIHRHAEANPDKIAVICGAEQMSYSALWSKIDERTKQLQASGLLPHRPHIFRASQNIDFLIDYCAAHLAGAVAVPLECKISDEALQTIQQEVEAEPFGEDIVDVLYTTGTTGKSKGVMLSANMWASSVENFIDSLKFSEELLFIVNGPLNHIGSLSKIYPTLSVGGTLCILDGLKDINTFFELFELPFKKFATFLVPTSIRLMMQLAYDKLCAVSDKIDFIETGAAPITKYDMELLAKALPNARLYNTLGATEAGAVTTYNFNDGRHIEGCVGYPMKNSIIEISPDGHIIISGKTLMSGYVGGDKSGNQVFRDGKLYTADLGYFDDEGMIHLRGRDGDVINIGGFKVDPTEVEASALSHPDIKDCICIAGTHPVIGTVLKLLFVPRSGAEPTVRDIARHIKSQLEPHKVPTYYDCVESIRRTYNGKLDRKAYKE